MKNLEELIAANAPNEGGRSESLHPSHSTMSDVGIWAGLVHKGLTTVFIDTITGTTNIRLYPDELEKLGAMLIAQARWMRQQP